MKNHRLVSLLCACALMAGTVPSANIYAEDADSVQSQITENTPEAADAQNAEEKSEKSETSETPDDETSSEDSKNDTWSITYRKGGGTGKIETTEPVKEKALVQLSPWALRKDGYSHVGWTDGENTYTRGQTIKMPAENLILEPVWEKIYTLTFEKLEPLGYITPYQDGTFSPGKELYLPNLAMHNGDASFSGWFVNGVFHKPLTTITLGAEDTYIEVYWQYPRELNYYAGDVEGVLGPDHFTVGKLAGLELDLSGKDRLARLGYKLSGWYEPVEDRKYRLEDRYLMPDRDVTMLAVWTPIKVGMDFYANGGEGKMSRQIEEFDSYVRINPCEFTKEGYKLLGWECGEDYYRPEATVQVKIAEIGDSMDFKAVWIEEDRNPGDVNGDGNVDVLDLSVLALHIIGDEIITDEQLLDDADVERDGKVDLSDLALLKKYIQKDKILLGIED